MIRLILGAALLMTAPGALAAQEAPAPAPLELSGNIAPVHDPAIVREDGVYHLFTTGNLKDKEGLIGWRTSTDLRNWTLQQPVFAAIPDWAKEAVPDTRGLWAPDIVRAGDEYRLYYSVSTFGKNRSAIGLATTPTLDRAAPGFGWVDQGLVWRSGANDDYNAIDPNIFIDDDGRHWMSFGSFWTGLKLVELDPATGKPLPDAKLTAIARRRSPGAVEAPFIIKRDGWYYLFASYDFCCRGADSSYYTVVGRSKAVAGPYVDRDGKAMMDGGGLLVLHAQLDDSKRFAGPGHISILRDGGRDHIVYHAYDKRAEGRPTLRIQRIGWTPDGWPVAL
ncbi:arabinan endo-1,5-alpha-L-arabinosidase [Sphingomonas gilva]